MQTFSEFTELNEVFNKVQPYTWVERTNKLHRAEFVAPNGKKYFVGLSYFEPFAWGDSEYEPYWNLNFGIDDKKLKDIDKEFDILGTGDQFVVFATVIAILKDFIARVRPAQIEFAANEPSRVKLYNRFIMLVGRALTGYKGVERDRGDYVI